MTNKIERCIWCFDPEIGMFHVPGCMGAAVNGPGSCTCVRDDGLRERLYATYRRLERSEKYADWARDQLIAAGLPFAPKLKG